MTPRSETDEGVAKDTLLYELGVESGPTSLTPCMLSTRLSIHPDSTSIDD